MKLHFIFMILQLLALVGQFVCYKRDKFEAGNTFWMCNIALFAPAMFALAAGN